MSVSRITSRFCVSFVLVSQILYNAMYIEASELIKSEPDSSSVCISNSPKITVENGPKIDFNVKEIGISTSNQNIVFEKALNSFVENYSSQYDIIGYTMQGPLKSYMYILPKNYIALENASYNCVKTEYLESLLHQTWVGFGVGVDSNNTVCVTSPTPSSSLSKVLESVNNSPSNYFEYPFSIINGIPSEKIESIITVTPPPSPPETPTPPELPIPPTNPSIDAVKWISDGNLDIMINLTEDLWSGNSTMSNSQIKGNISNIIEAFVNKYPQYAIYKHEINGVNKIVFSKDLEWETDGFYLINKSVKGKGLYLEKISVPKLIAQKTIDPPFSQWIPFEDFSTGKEIAIDENKYTLLKANISISNRAGDDISLDVDYIDKNYPELDITTPDFNTSDLTLQFQQPHTLSISLSSNVVNFGDISGLDISDSHSIISLLVSSSASYDINIKALDDIKGTVDNANSIDISKLNVSIDSNAFESISKTSITLISDNTRGLANSHSLLFRLESTLGAKSDSYSVPLKLNVCQK